MSSLDESLAAKLSKSAPRCCDAALRTMGVSSKQSSLYKCGISECFVSVCRAGNMPATLTLAVNQSAPTSRLLMLTSEVMTDASSGVGMLRQR